MSKRKDGVFSLLRHIIGNQKKIIKEQEKQTKILQAIESSKEQEIDLQIDAKKIATGVLDQSGSTFKTSFKTE